MVSLGRLTLDAHDLHRDRDGQKAIVTVRCRRTGLCYRQRMNFDDVRQRAQCITNVALACERGGTAAGHHPRCRLAHRVTEPLLIELGEACRGRPTELPPDPTGDAKRRAAAAAVAERHARALLDDPDVLSRVDEAMRANGYVGDLAPARLVYVALTSRLLERPLNLAVVADAAAGKNATLDAALALVPPEAVYVFSASSPTSIVYTDEQFAHRVVVFKEADSIPDTGPAASAVRALADDQELRYEVTVLDPRTGAFETRKIIKAGPTGLLTTSLRALRRQLHTRVLQVPVAADPETTRAVLRAKGRQAAGRTLRPCQRAPFLALQHWLALAGPPRVIVPFGEELAELIPISADLRVRRDFEKVLSCVKTLALLRQRRRQRSRRDEVIATLEDYAAARDLLLGSFYAAAWESVPPTIRETVEAVGQRGRDVSEADLAKDLGLSKQAVSRRVRNAIEKHWLVNDEPRPGKPARLRCDEPLPGDVAPLPEVQDVTFALTGVPPPALNVRFRAFAATLATAWPQGVTVAEWAAHGKRQPGRVREGLEALVTGGFLRKRKRHRYTLRGWVRTWIAGLDGAEWTAGEP